MDIPHHYTDNIRPVVRTKKQNKKKSVEGREGGFRVDVNEALKFLYICQKSSVGSGWGQGGCERRIEVFVKLY